jgi:hypothetical protein
VAGIGDVRASATGLVVTADGPARGDLVRALVLDGVRVDRVAAQHGLEDAFLALVGEAEQV